VICSERVAVGAVQQLRTAQQSQDKLCHTWLDTFAHWIDAGPNIQNKNK
jgi:hypothetical protein